MERFSPELSAEKKPSDAPQRWRVILYNNNRHRFDDVVGWLEKATGCSYEFAIEICHVCQDQGRAVCFQGPKAACREVTEFLREQRLQVEVDDY